MTTMRVALKRGLLTERADLAEVRFLGSRCADCRVTVLGVRQRCENCSSRNLQAAELASSGVVHSWTVQRYPPPPPFIAPSPWTPRAIAWIDLDDNGPRIMGVLSGPPAAVRIGMRVRAEFVIGWRDEQEREVISFLFHPAG